MSAWTYTQLIWQTYGRTGIFDTLNTFPGCSRSPVVPSIPVGMTAASEDAAMKESNENLEVKNFILGSGRGLRTVLWTRR